MRAFALFCTTLLAALVVTVAVSAGPDNVKFPVNYAKGVLYTATGEFLETDRPNKVSLTFGMPQFSHEFDLITVTFEADGDGCIMRFRQEGIAQMAKGPSESGWTPMFEGLAQAIGAPPPKKL